MIVDGNDVADYGFKYYGEASKPLIENVRIRQCEVAGLWTEWMYDSASTQGTYNHDISNLEVENCNGVGVYLGGRSHTVVFDKPYIWYNAGGGIFVDGDYGDTYVKMVMIRDGAFVHNEAFEIKVGRIRNMIIEGNYFEHGYYGTNPTIILGNNLTKTASTISFTDSNPDTIHDSAGGFLSYGFCEDAGLKEGYDITVSGSASNDGTYEIASITADTITLVATETFSTEAAGNSVTISAAGYAEAPVVENNAVSYSAHGGGSDYIVDAEYSKGPVIIHNNFMSGSTPLVADVKSPENDDFGGVIAGNWTHGGMATSNGTTGFWRNYEVRGEVGHLSLMDAATNVGGPDDYVEIIKYDASTIAFVDSNPDTITDSASQFVAEGFEDGQTIGISGSASNDGTYTIASVTAGTITLSSTDELTAEGAGASVSVSTPGESLYYSASLTFVDSNPDTITDANSQFINEGFVAGQTITGSGTVSNDGNYTIASVAVGTITLISSDTLANEAAVSCVVSGDYVTYTPDMVDGIVHELQLYDNVAVLNPLHPREGMLILFDMRYEGDYEALWGTNFRTSWEDPYGPAAGLRQTMLCYYRGDSSVWEQVGAGSSPIGTNSITHYHARGSATIASGNTYVTIAHGLNTTPKVVLVTGGHAEVADAYVSSVGGTNIVIATAVATSADRTVYWTAWCY